MNNLLHIYPQPGHHQAAWIAGDREALRQLRNAIDLALSSGEPQGVRSFTNDGEGYVAVVIPTSASSFESLQLPYGDTRATEGAPPYEILRPGTYLKLMRTL